MIRTTLGGRCRANGATERLARGRVRARPLPAIALVVTAFGGPAAAAQEGDPPGVLSFRASYSGDVFANLAGGRRRDVAYLDNIDVTVAIDLERSLGWSGGTLYVYGLGNQGGDPSGFVADAQGVNNIEAVDAWRIYELWLQQRLLRDHLSLLAGLYDLNSEFDVILSAAAFINSSFGIGPEFALSREMGPSIFPVTGLGARLRAVPASPVYVQLAVLDGVPGDPDAPEATHVEFASNDGALLVGEIGLLLGGPDAASAPGRVQRARRRRVSRLEAARYAAKLAIGSWAYTAEFPRVLPAQVPPQRQRGNWGMYALAEVQARAEAEDATQGLWIFGRVGVADPAVNRFASYTGAGLSYRGPLRGRDDDEVGLAVAAAHNGADYRAAERAAGRATTRTEVALELTYSAAVTANLGLQGDVQYVVAPNTDPTLGDALVVGLRMQLGF